MQVKVLKPMLWGLSYVIVRAKVNVAVFPSTPIAVMTILKGPLWAVWEAWKVILSFTPPKDW